jgi:UDP-N-acetyl-2-amino-2-deoxyglucuronate dehydrogenase
VTSSIGVGIVGCGGAAVDLVAAIDTLEGLRLAAALDRVPALARELCEPRGAQVATDLADLLANPGVEIAYIALPHHLLAGATQAALESGRHALVEKPMALELATIDGLQVLATAREVVLGVAFQLRAVPAIVAARRLVAEGAIGEVQLVRVRTVIDKPEAYWRSGPTGRVEDGWRAFLDQAGGGVVLMNSIHQLDLVRFVTGLEMERATAEVAGRDGREVEDRASASIRLSNGGLLSVVATSASPGARDEERMEVDGTLGRLDLPDPYGTGALRAFLRAPASGLPSGQWTDVPSTTEDAAGRIDPVADLLLAFVAAVRGETPPLATAEDAAAALAAVQAIYRAAETRRAVDIQTQLVSEVPNDA